jgi:hypothetical protein
MMAGSKTLPSKGRIQMSKTNYLQIVTSGLQRTAGPYRSAKSGLMHRKRKTANAAVSPISDPVFWSNRHLSFRFLRHPSRPHHVRDTRNEVGR